jgi:serine/threonine protein kinase
MNFEFLGPYQVESVLGQGGMGTVYQGKHSKTGDVVAIKVIASSLADQERFRRRFAAEVETLKRLKHPNIVQLIGYGEEHGHLFYSMDFVAGKSLSDSIREAGHLPWKQAIDIAIEVVSALKHAHDFGIIHRDLKPANVMLDPSGHVKLTDFGIAKLFGSSEVTAAGSILGTADYMPPEQAEGKVVTTRSDLYALGALIYAMIAGRSPHHAKSVPEVLYNVRYGQPESLTRIAPSTPTELDELVFHLLKKEMSERPPTALVVSNRLQSLRIGLHQRERPSVDGPSQAVDQLQEFTSIDLSPASYFPPSPSSIQRAEEQTQVAPSDQHPAAGGSALEPSEPRDRRRETQGGTKVSSTDFSIHEEPPLSRKTSFTVVEESDRIRSQQPFDSSPSPIAIPSWLSIAAIIALLACSLGAIFYFTRPASADRLYAKVLPALERGDEDALLEVEPFLDEFAERFPDDSRMEEIVPARASLEQLRMVRRLFRQARSGTEAAKLEPIERAFVDCVRHGQQMPGTAEQRWRAFLTVFEHSPPLTSHHEKLLQFARIELSKVQRRADPSDNRTVQKLLADFQREKAQQSPDAFRRYCQALIELYEDQAWAAPLVEEAKAWLKSHDAP